MVPPESERPHCLNKLESEFFRENFALKTEHNVAFMFVHVCLPRLFDPHLRALFIQFVGGSTRESISRVSIATLPRVFTFICAVFFFFFYSSCVLINNKKAIRSRGVTDCRARI